VVHKNLNGQVQSIHHYYTDLDWEKKLRKSKKSKKKFHGFQLTSMILSRSILHRSCAKHIGSPSKGRGYLYFLHMADCFNKEWPEAFVGPTSFQPWLEDYRGTPGHTRVQIRTVLASPWPSHFFRLGDDMPGKIEEERPSVSGPTWAHRRYNFRGINFHTHTSRKANRSE
jgi:hypothetical protein